jgi:hypothetical protein
VRTNTLSGPLIPQTQPAAAPVDPASALTYATSNYAAAVQEQLEQRGKGPATRPVETIAERIVDLPLPEVDWIKKDVTLAIGPPQSGEGPDKIESHPAETAKAKVADSPVQKAPSQGSLLIAGPLPPSMRESKPTTADDLSRTLAQRVKEDPRNIISHLDYQLVQFVLGQHVPQMNAIASLTGEDQEVLSAILDGLANFRAVMSGDDNSMLSKKVRPLLEMADRLRPKVELKIPALTLCSRVDGFGAYETMSAGTLAAGREQGTIIYCEVENFSSRMNERGLWQTSLTYEAALMDEKGKVVWDDKRLPVSDTCRSRRNDFYVIKKVKWPALAAGDYFLKVRVTDAQANRGQEATLAVKMVAR